MKEATRQYEDGDVIFREGEDSLSVFLLVSGHVRLFKTGPSGQFHLATLGKAEMFGELGILDRAPRNATAIAEGRVGVTVIPRGEFLERLQHDPELALKVMTKLVHRLRDADDRLARVMPPEPPAVAAVETEPLPIPAAVHAKREASRPGLLSRLFGRNKGEAKEAEAAPVGPLKILVSRPGDDLPPEAAATLDAAVSALQLIPGALVRRIDDAVAWPEGVRDPEAARLGAAQAAAALLAARGGDVLVWGRRESIGNLFEIHATASAAPHELRLGRMPTAAAVFVPFEALVEPLPALLRVLVAGAALAEGLRRMGDQMGCLAGDVLTAAEGLKRAVSGYAAAEQAAVQLAWANAAGLVAAAEDPPGPLWDAATKGFDDAVRRLPRGARHDWADALIGRALLEQARAEHGATPEPEDAKPGATVWDATAETLRLALDGVRREERPWDWALLNERLGLIDYRRALETGDEAHFKSALACCQAAIQVYTRAEFPLKWAEIVSALSQALQVYGDHLGSVAALERAVELCAATLEVRSEDTQPLLWAASQNNLGSALFLLAKRKGGLELFQASAEAFRNALAVYQINGQSRLAGVTEKNLARAADACRGLARRDGRRAQPEWAEESAAPEETP